MAAAAILLWGCQTPAVETDAPDYSTTGYAYDVSVCNAADLVRNSAEGAVEVVKGMGMGLVYGAAITADNRNNDLALVLGGVLVGTVGGTAYGLYKAVEQIDLTVDDCMAREGFQLAGNAGTL